MKRTIALALAAVLALGLFAGCGAENGGESSPEPSAAVEELTAGERAQLYADAILAARGAEENEAYPVSKSGDEVNSMVFDMLGFDESDTEAMALSVSLINIKAYGIAVVMPAEGSGETVEAGLNGFIENQKAGFEHYLQDQYEVAAAARLETLSDGTVVMVMCSGQDEVFESIVSAIESA